MLMYSLRYQLDLKKMPYGCWPRAFFLKSVKPDNAWMHLWVKKGTEGVMSVLLGGSTMQRLRAWTLGSNCLGSNIRGTPYQLCHLGHVTYLLLISVSSSEEWEWRY